MISESKLDLNEWWMNEWWINLLLHVKSYPNFPNETSIKHFYLYFNTETKRRKADKDISNNIYFFQLKVKSWEKNLVNTVIIMCNKFYSWPTRWTIESHARSPAAEGHERHRLSQEGGPSLTNAAENISSVITLCTFCTHAHTHNAGVGGGGACWLLWCVQVGCWSED